MKLPKGFFPASVIGTCVGVGVIIWDSAQGKKYESEAKLTGKTVIVTGASSGIGKATAMELARRGGRVIMACQSYNTGLKARDEIREETYNPNIEVKLLDLASLDSIAQFAEDINKNEKRVDVLVNNAGVMQFGKKRALTSDGFERHLGVNYLGPFLLTNLLMPKLAQCKPARVVNLVTVSMNKSKLDFDDFNASKKYDPPIAYGNSKLCLMALTDWIGKHHKDVGVTSYAVYPGVAKTQLSRGLAKSNVSSAVFKPSELLMRTAENAAHTVIWCCVEPGIEDQSGKCFKDMRPFTWQTKLSDADSLRLWKISNKWTRLEKYQQSILDNINDLKLTKS